MKLIVSNKKTWRYTTRHYRHQPPSTQFRRVRLTTWVTEQTETAVQIAANRAGLSRSAFIAGVLMKHVEDAIAVIMERELS